MKDAQDKLKPLKEVKNCPLVCQYKGTTKCRRTSCQKLDQYLKNIPCNSCPKYDKKICKVNCPRVTQWNEVFHWRENTGDDGLIWDSYHRYQIPDLQEDVTVSPENKVPKDVLLQFKEKTIPEALPLTEQKEEKPQYEYTRRIIGKKRQAFIKFSVIPDKKEKKMGYTILTNVYEVNFRPTDGKRIKKLPANAKIVCEDNLKRGYKIDSLIDKAADKVAKTRSIPYEDALDLVYKTSRPCENPACFSMIPHPKFKVVDKRRQFCCDACQKSYQRNKV